MRKAKPGFQIVINFFKKEFEIPDDWDCSEFDELKSKKPYLEILKKGLMQKLLAGEIRIAT